MFEESIRERPESTDNVKEISKSVQRKKKPCVRREGEPKNFIEEECESYVSSCTEASTSTGNLLNRIIHDPSRNREPYLKEWPRLYPKCNESVNGNPHQYKASLKKTQLEQMCFLRVDSTPNSFRLPAIIATLGPNSKTPDSVFELIESGMSIARVNMAHIDPCNRAEHFQNVIEASNRFSASIDYKIPIGIMMDLKGPEIRTGNIDPGSLKETSGGGILLEKGRYVRIMSDVTLRKRCTEKFIFVDMESFSIYVQPGMEIYVEKDIVLKVESIENVQVVCKVHSKGILKNYQQVHVPKLALPLPPVTDYDRECLSIASKLGVDIVVVPKTRNENIVYSVKDHLGNNEDPGILVFAKISNYEGVRNIEAIIEAADGIVIHKNDLALEMPPAKIFIAQKEIIAKCNKVGKPVICPVEIKSTGDVAQYIVDGADCLLLSSDTAIEENGPEKILRLSGMIKEAEAATMQTPFFRDLVNTLTPSIEPNYAIALAAVDVANKIRAAAIVTITTSGRTAHLLSWFRPRCPVIAVTRIGRVARQLNSWRSVTPLLYSGQALNDWFEDCGARIRYGITYGKDREMIRPGDALVLVTGYKKNSGFANCIRIAFASLEGGEIAIFDFGFNLNRVREGIGPIKKYLIELGINSSWTLPGIIFDHKQIPDMRE